MFGNTANYTLVAPSAPSGTTPAGTFIKTSVALTGGAVNSVVHNIGVNPVEVTAFESDGITQIRSILWDIVDVNTVAISVADSYANSIIKFIF
jgi:hypothetical protein